MADEAQRVVDLFGGAVSLAPGGITVRDPSKLRSPATDRLVWQAVLWTVVLLMPVGASYR